LLDLEWYVRKRNDRGRRFQLQRERRRFDGAVDVALGFEDLSKLLPGNIIVAMSTTVEKRASNQWSLKF